MAETNTPMILHVYYYALLLFSSPLKPDRCNVQYLKKELNPKQHCVKMSIFFKCISTYNVSCLFFANRTNFVLIYLVCMFIFKVL